MNVIRFFSWIICGGVILLLGLAVIACCVAWGDDDE